jgi:predicted 3-demethylubiquinone-9 3-methyltransferase (glyoxalase superfamily)
MQTQKIVPFLWFDNNAEEAMNFYASIFQDSKILKITRNGPDGPGTPGTALVGTLEIAGQTFMVLNGGPLFKFTEAVSFLVNCEKQEEVDELWKKLTAGGGEPGRCGWLKDKFGLSWQIVPTILPKLLSDNDPRKAGRAMKAMLQMTKIDIAGLQRAYEQE